MYLDGFVYPGSDFKLDLMISHDMSAGRTECPLFQDFL